MHSHALADTSLIVSPARPLSADSLIPMLEVHLLLACQCNIDLIEMVRF
jgi:hypothetical protein